MSDPTEILLTKLRALQSTISKDTSAAQIAALISRQMSDIGECAAVAGYPGLLDICLMLKDGLDSLPDNGDNLTDADIVALASWPGILIDYVITPTVPGKKEVVMQLLCRPAWGAFIDTETAELLKNMLDIIPEATKKPAATVKDPDQTPADVITDVGKTDAWDSMDTSVSKELPPQLREVVEIMISELGNIYQSLEKLRSLHQAGVDSVPFTSALNDLTRTLEFYGEAVKSIDFKGLAEVVKHTRQNVIALPGLNENQRNIVLALLGAWSQQILAYLRNPLATGAVKSILDFMQDGGWPVQVDNKQALKLADVFHAQVFKSQADRPERKKTATADDVSLTLQDDVSRELLDGLLQELPLQTGQFSSAILRLINGGTLEDIIIAKRVAHTLKGAGNTVGIRGIATLTHHLEDILLALSKNECLPGTRIAETLMDASDCLAAMSESLLGLGEPPEDALAILQEVLDLANVIDAEGIDVVNARAPNQRSPGDGETGAKIANVAPGQPPEKNEHEHSAMIRVSSDFINHLLQLAGETIIMTGQIRTNIKATLAEIKEMAKKFDLLKQLGGKLEQIIDIRDLNQAQQAANNGKFDALEMDQYTELHMYNRQLVEMAMDADEISQSVSKNLVRLEDMLVDQSRINDEMQEGVMRTRMLPVSSQFPRLQRCIRQAEKLTGKVVDLQLVGGETLIDNDTLNNLLDPLMHLLRNAIDHGIEPEEERSAAGKGARGRITMEFLRQGNNILARCRDDGRGLDLHAIQRKAVEQGLIEADQKITEDELRQFIMHSGFSTRSETTQVSGRGIGMDAVNAAIIAMSGTIRIESESGNGCLVEISIPQNLISMHTLLIRVGPQIMAIANRGIAQIVHHKDGSISGNDEKLIFHTGNYDCPAQTIYTLLNIAPDRRAQVRHPPTVILFQIGQAEGSLLAVMVDKIISTADLVVKGLGQYVPKVPGLLGVAILGDGSVTAVLDIPELLRARADAGVSSSQFARSDYQHARLPSALVVDDSLSARRSLEQFMHDAGYTVRSARDGLEALDMIKMHKPDILLSDLEMPRMNGLELLSRVRADQTIADIPVIMVTSRAAAKHRQEAMDTGVDVYLTKPYSEDELLEHIHKLRRIC